MNLRTLKPKDAMSLEPIKFIKWITNHRGGHAHELKTWCNRYLGLRFNPQMNPQLSHQPTEPMNYDTEIRRIAEEVRLILNNCTDAPRLLREYAGLYTEGEAQREIAAPLQDRIDELGIELTEAKDSLSEAEGKIENLRDQITEHLD
jgi:hypothetical protein